MRSEHPHPLKENKYQTKSYDMLSSHTSLRNVDTLKAIPHTTSLFICSGTCISAPSSYQHPVNFSHSFSPKNKDYKPEKHQKKLQKHTNKI